MDFRIVKYILRQKDSIINDLHCRIETLNQYVSLLEKFCKYSSSLYSKPESVIEKDISITGSSKQENCNQLESSKTPKVPESVNSDPTSAPSVPAPPMDRGYKQT